MSPEPTPGNADRRHCLPSDVQYIAHACKHGSVERAREPWSTSCTLDDDAGRYTRKRECLGGCTVRQERENARSFLPSVFPSRIRFHEVLKYLLCSFHGFHECSSGVLYAIYCSSANVYIRTPACYDRLLYTAAGEYKEVRWWTYSVINKLSACDDDVLYKKKS